MSLPGLYLDEDVQWDALIAALRARGISVLTTSEAGMTKHTDEEQLRFAASSDRVFVTSNIADFAKAHAKWIEVGDAHCGIILVPQQKWGPGELARRIIRLLADPPDKNLHNRIEFLSSS